MLMAYRDLILLGFKVQKRRLWTSLDDELVGRWKLKSFLILLIYIKNNNLKFLLEYQLEYRSTGRYSPRSVV